MLSPFDCGCHGKSPLFLDFRAFPSGLRYLSFQKETAPKAPLFSRLVLPLSCQLREPFSFFCLRPNLLHNRNPVLCHVLRGGNLIEKVEFRKADELPSALGEGQDAAVVLEVNPGKHLIDVLRNTVIATLLPLEEYGIFGDGRNTSFPVPVAFATKLENVAT